MQQKTVKTSRLNYRKLPATVQTALLEPFDLQKQAEKQLDEITDGIMAGRCSARFGTARAFQLGAQFAADVHNQKLEREARSGK